MVTNRVKVAIIEPSEIIRIGVEHIIDGSSQLSIAYSAAMPSTSIEEGVDIVIVNIDRLISLGHSAIAELYPSAEVVALIYSYVSPEHRALADAAIEICDPASKVLETLHRGVELDSGAAAKSDSGELSEREMEIVAAVARGMINKEIAESLNISIHTVMAHRKNISRKTGIRSISGLVVYALLNGLIEQNEVLK